MGRGALVRGALGCVSPANLSQVYSAGWGVSRLQSCPQHLEVCEVYSPERPDRVAGSSPDKHALLSGLQSRGVCGLDDPQTCTSQTQVLFPVGMGSL